MSVSGLALRCGRWRLRGDVTVVAHAGTVRAALALAVGPTAALAFEVAPLSVTRLRALSGWRLGDCRGQLDRAMTSIRVHGHFGEFMQGRLGPAGPVCARHDCLLDDVGRLRIARFSMIRTVSCPPACARKLLEQLSLPDPGPVLLARRCRAGGGAGASTAALVAYARLAGSTHDSLALARACVAAEGASDPLMFAKPDQLLWASRLGEIVDRCHQCRV
jgi:uncharacterized protein involved in propanediol utilization